MMSIEHWGVLALLVLLPLLEGVARFRRARASNGGAIDGVGEVRTSQRGSSIPNRDVDPAISLSRLSASRTAYKESASIEAHTTSSQSVGGDPVAQWLRPVRNLRHAIVVATILDPPPRQ